LPPIEEKNKTFNLISSLPAFKRARAKNRRGKVKNSKTNNINEKDKRRSEQCRKLK